MGIFINFWRFHYYLCIYYWRCEMHMRDYIRFKIGYGGKVWEVGISRTGESSRSGRRELGITVKLSPFINFSNTMIQKVIEVDGMCRVYNIFSGHILGYRIR